MKNMPDKKELIKEVILNNPNLSGNKVYEITKKRGIGIRKTDFYSLFRETKDLPEPTLEKRERSIPIRYRAIKPEIKEPSKIPIPTKEGQYGIIEVIDDKGNSRWIKYRDKKSLDKQMDKIKQEYGKKKIIFHGFNTYAEFIDKEFKAELKGIGIFL